MPFENRYSAIDRLLHRLAFSTSSVQVGVADLEDKIFASRLDPIEIRKPVFVTALPRAGTTLLLETIESLGEFVSHSYRNMPFLLCPLLWNSFSSRFHRPGEVQERAHQDGMLVGDDSPEAFEEIIWKAFWRRNYESDRIRPWIETDEDFFHFMRSHMRKIISLAVPAPNIDFRYLSKNNLNIARIDLLASNFPDAVFIVPFREPLQHAASLLHQHINFLEIHRRDRFARDYMAGIGHYDFGENLRPVDFGGWLDRANSSDPTTLSFWLEYWIAAYEHLEKCGAASLLCYEELCTLPSTVLERLAELLQIDDRPALLKQSSRFRPPRPHSVDVDHNSEIMVKRAQELYHSLRKSSFH